MKLRYKVTGGIVLFVVAALSSLAVVLSHNSPCEPAPALASGVQQMQAVVSRCYGPPDVLTLERVEKPTVSDNDVLVKVRAASVNPLDWHYMRGSPYLMRLMSGLGSPDDVSVGVDFSGVVEAVGENVERFEPGDEVFGARGGAFSEYVIIPEDRAIVLKPANVSFEQAAAVPIAATTALQALRDAGGIEAGQKVLINGASGGVGTFAVQIAKSFGAEVTGVCSTRNVEMVRSIGADRVFDYTREDYTQSGQRFDLIIDNVGNHSFAKNRHALNPDGLLVIVGAQKGDWIAPFMGLIKAFMVSPFIDQEFDSILARLTQEDLTLLANLMESGTVTPVIDRRYSLTEVPEALRYSETGRARGKIIISLE